MSGYCVPIASIAGIVVAASIAALFRFLRRRALLFSAILGWSMTAFACVCIVLFVAASVASRNELHPDLGPLWWIVGAAIALLLGICGLIGWLQSRRLHLSPLRLFACMVLEAGVVFLLLMLLNNEVYSIADYLRGARGDNTRLILDSFDRARNLLSAFGCALALSLLACELIQAFFLKPTNAPEPRATDRRATAIPDIG